MIQSRPRYVPILVLVVIALSSTLPPASALEATWTPAESSPDEAGPLPLSQKQRQQLLQIDQHISSSSNPTEALQQVASSNNMDPNDLYQMLLRNRNDMQMASGGGGVAGSTLPRKLLRLIQTVAMLILSYAKVHPRRFSVVLVCLTTMLYLLYSAPR